MKKLLPESMLDNAALKDLLGKRLKPVARGQAVSKAMERHGLSQDEGSNSRIEQGVRRVIRTARKLASGRVEQLGVRLAGARIASDEEPLAVVQQSRSGEVTRLAHVPDLGQAIRYRVIDFGFGIERFEDAWTRRVEREGFPIAHIDDIIRSKRAVNWQRDKESLPRLEQFREWLKDHPATLHRVEIGARGET